MRKCKFHKTENKEQVKMFNTLSGIRKEIKEVEYNYCNKDKIKQQILVCPTNCAWRK